ncbi:AbrB/MazE/SpoVT family DNA-binding domain-containing protein [Neobacillus sp. LXY-1]|uniref:AbrB/MazE/SpoVT family DNA-binding domain-containing protein n=1 Tax=Neobacillus sp. LXY-1 TaxID=3379133 RepID=UPI003EE1FF1B
MIDYRGFLGTTTIDKNGQIELPLSIREKFEQHEKLVVAGGRNKESIILIKAETMDKLAFFQLNHSKKFEKLANDILAKADLADTKMSFPNNSKVMNKEDFSENRFDDDHVLDLFDEAEFNAFLEEILG